MREGYKKTEVGIIPKEWDVIKVGDLVNTLKSGLSRSLKDDNIGIPCIRSNNIKNNRLVLNDLKYWFRVDDKGAKVEEYLLKSGDIIINFINSISQIGKGCIFDRDDFETIYTTNLLRIQVKAEKINNKFFYYYTQTEKYKNEISFITKPAVNQASFTTVEYKAIKFPVPKLKEQEKIAEILSIVDSQIDDMDKLIAKTKELKKGLMQKLLTKGIGHKEFKKTEIGEIPVEWQVDILNNISDVRDGTHESPKYVDQGIPFITSKNLKEHGIDFSDINYISNEDHEKFSQRSSVDNGDILFGMIGTIGNPVIVRKNFEFSIKNVALIKFNDNNISNIFLLNILKSNLIEKQFEKLSNGGVQKFIALGMIRNLLIPVPSVEEQQKIANILSAVDIQIEEYQNNKIKLEELKKALIQYLLTGKIRVF